MKGMSSEKRSSKAGLMKSAAGLLLVLTVLATVTDAAAPGTSMAGLAITVQQSVASAAANVVVVNGGGVVIPSPPQPRSPFQPPVFVPVVPVRPTPVVTPPKPTWLKK